MFILIYDVDGNQYIVKKSDIRRVYQTTTGITHVVFTTTKNSPITIKETPKDFFSVYLDK